MKKTRSKWFYALLILFSAIFIAAVLVGFAGCSGCNEEEEEGATVSDVTVTAEQTSLTVGDTTKLTAAVTMSDGSDYEGSYSWSSGAQDVATVSGSGAEVTVTALSEGTAAITVSVSDDKSASVTVSVAAVPTLSISIADELDLDLASESTKTGTLTASLAMSDNSTVPSDIEVSWSSSDNNNAVISLSATTGTSVTVTAVANGTATVTATAGGVSATCEVYVAGPASLVLSGTDAALMNAKTESGSSASSTLMSADATTGAVSNITVGDLVVYQILASNVPDEGTEATVTVSVPQDASAADIELYVESEEETSEETPTDEPTPTALTDGSATVTLVNGINYVVLTAASTATSGASLSGMTLDWHQEKVSVNTGTTIRPSYSTIMGPDIELVETSDTVFDIGTDGKATIEAEDATLFNAVGVTGSTNLLGTEETVLNNNLTLTNVKNFNTIGDSIVFQVNAEQTLSNVQIDITACNAALSSGTFADNDSILSVNGGSPIQLSGALTHGSFDYKSYGTLTGTISLNAGINYIVITAASTAGTGYLNVDRIDLAGGAHGSVEAARVVKVTSQDARLSAGDNLAFDASDLTIDYDPATETYTLSGQGSTMGEDLAKAFYSEAEADTHAACQYITFAVAANEGETLTITTYNGKTVEKSWTMVGGEDTDNASTTDGLFVVDLTDHTTGDWEMIIEVVYSDGTTTSYAVVLGTITRAVEASRVAAATSGDERLTVKDELAFSASDITVEYDADSRTYTISGTSKVMGEDLATAVYGTDHAECEYITFEVAANEGETLTITTYNGKTIENSWTMVGGEDTDNVSTTDGLFVLDLTNHSGNGWSMVLEVEYADGMTVTYTVVLGTIESAHYDDEDARISQTAANSEDLKAEDQLSFTATSDLTVEYDPDTRTYTISGTSAAFTSELANAFYGGNGSSHTDCEYITFTISVNAGETIKITIYNGDEVQKVRAMYGEGVNETTDGLKGDEGNAIQKASDGTWIIDLEDHFEETEGCDWKMELEVTYANGDKVTYTVVLGEITQAATEDPQT